MTDIKLLHAADIHLGRPFSGLERTSPYVADLFRHAAYTAWQRIVESAIALRVDAVMLAGDIFDSSNPSVRARVVFREGINRLYEESIPVFLAAGNHDPLPTYSDSLKNLPGLLLFGPEPEGGSVTSREITEGVMVFGAGFAKAAVRENLARKFRRDPGIDFAVGVLHTNVSSISGHQDYAPCTPEDLLATGMDVWCLGHVHSHSILRDYPLIVYPGTSQGARVEETGPRGCCLVTIKDVNEVSAEFVPVGPVRWESLDLNMSEVSDIEETITLAESACEGLCPHEESVDAVVVNITLCGRPETPVSFTQDDVLVLAEQLERLPVPVFLGSLRNLTGTALDVRTLESEEGFLGDFIRLCKHTAQDEGALEDVTALVRTELVHRIGTIGGYDTGPGALTCTNRDLSERLLDETEKMVIKLFFEPQGGKGSRG